MKCLADALIEAVAYIELRPNDDLMADDDVRALEYVTSILRRATDVEQKELAQAVSRALATATSDDRRSFLYSFSESILGE